MALRRRDVAAVVAAFASCATTPAPPPVAAPAAEASPDEIVFDAPGGLNETFVANFRKLIQSVDPRAEVIARGSDSLIVRGYGSREAIVNATGCRRSLWFAPIDDERAADPAHVPDGYVVLPAADDSLDPATNGRAFLVSRTELLSNFDARDGSVAEDPFGVNVRLELEKEAGEKLAAYARSHPGQRLAVVSRGRVIVAPVMGGAIGSRIVIKVGNDAGARERAQRILSKWLEAGLGPAVRLHAPDPATE